MLGEREVMGGFREMGFCLPSYCPVFLWYRLSPGAGRRNSKTGGNTAGAPQRLDGVRPLSIARGARSKEIDFQTPPWVSGRLTSVIDLIVAAFVYYLPAYSVNAGMLFVGSIVEGGFPVSTKWLGSRKTFDGLFFAICCGLSVGFLVSSPQLGIFLGIGAWLGTLGGSLVKRQLSIKLGAPAPVLDQLDFIIGATLLGLFVEAPRVEYFLIIICATPFIHRAMNILAYKVGLKNVPY
jgi:CDP-2,3-bis-(O-geranylgeranyl)-sn-glycerol synthase